MFTEDKTELSYTYFNGAMPRMFEAAACSIFSWVLNAKKNKTSFGSYFSWRINLAFGKSYKKTSLVTHVLCSTSSFKYVVERECTTAWLKDITMTYACAAVRFYLGSVLNWIPSWLLKVPNDESTRLTMLQKTEFTRDIIIDQVQKFQNSYFKVHMPKAATVLQKAYLLKVYHKICPW